MSQATFILVVALATQMGSKYDTKAVHLSYPSVIVVTKKGVLEIIPFYIEISMV